MPQAQEVSSLFRRRKRPAAAGMFKEFTGRDIGFFELSQYMFLVGWVMVFLIWEW